MQALAKLKNIFLNIYSYKVVLMVMLVPTLLADLTEYNYKILFIMMGWGAVLCVWDFFSNRRFLKAKGMFWLICFLIVFLLTIILNRTSDNFSLNFSSFAYTVIALLLLYPDHTGGDKKRVIKELNVICYEFVIMTIILSSISFVMFLIQYARVFRCEGSDAIYTVGWDFVQNRLYGVYGNMGYMTSAIGIALAVIIILIRKSKQKKLGVIRGIVLIYSFVINFVSMCVENAKGAFVSIAAFAFVFTLFAVGKCLNKVGIKKVKRIILDFVAAIAAAAVVIGMIYAIRPVLAFLPPIVESITETNENNEVDNNELNQVNIDRVIDENHKGLTGRTKIWKFGAEEFIKRPLIGYGPNSHRNYPIMDNLGLRHFHNLFVQCLVSVGIIGSLFLFGFLFMALFSLVRKLIYLIDKQFDYYLVVSGLLALLVMFAVNSMGEVTIIFLTRFTMFIFWIVLGYLRTLVDDNKVGRTDKWLLTVDSKLSKILSRKKG